MRWVFVLALFALTGCAALQKSAAPAVAPANTVQQRWFSGWAAINGGGPHARATNTDWHMQNDLQLASDGGRVVLHWRDGVPTGYSLELARVSYPERKLVVLQLSVIEDKTGKPLAYVWADDKADAIGLNLGWLQVGLQEQAPLPAAHKAKP